MEELETWRPSSHFNHNERIWEVERKKKWYRDYIVKVRRTHLEKKKKKERAYYSQIKNDLIIYQW